MSEEFMSMMQTTKPGDIVTLKIKRGEEELEIKPTLGKRPANNNPLGNRGDVQNHMGGDLSNPARTASRNSCSTTRF